jgi:hypothetical protein
MDLENGEWLDGGTSQSSSGDDAVATHEVDYENLERLQRRRGTVPQQGGGVGSSAAAWAVGSPAYRTRPEVGGGA